MTRDEFFAKIVEGSPEFTLTDEIKKALELAEFSSQNLFITGKAGSGKSNFLKILTKYSAKKIVVVAPTGVAAVNVGGQTIHSLFRFPIGILDGTHRPSDSLMELWESFEILFIDEISMVRADLFNAVDKAMRKAGDKTKPFGGKQVIVSGDLWQLPPVVSTSERQVFSEMFGSRWFFSNDAIKSFSVIEFDKVFRQTDANFIETLSRCRNGSHTYADINHLNTRCKPYTGTQAIVITTTNANADLINNEKLSKIKSSIHTFTGKVTGCFPESSMAAPMYIKLKVGAKIMVLRNIPKLGLVNGSIRYVRSVVDDSIMISKTMNDSESDWQQLSPMTWEQYEYSLEDGQLQKDVVGSYTQLPVKLGFAVTIHRSQGITVDEAVIDFDRGVFESGQAYVALSRVRSIDGLFLKQPIKHSDFRVDKDVKNYFNEVYKSRQKKAQRFSFGMNFCLKL